MIVKVLGQDDDYKVSILLQAHELLTTQNLPMADLTEGQKTFLLCMVIQDLQKKGYNTKVDKRYFHKIMTIEPGAQLVLAPPFDSMGPALNWLSTYNDLSDPEEYVSILEEIGELYKEQEGIEGAVYTAIFHKPICGVKGYCAHITNNRIVILFWAFDDLITEDIEV